MFATRTLEQKIFTYAIGISIAIHVAVLLLFFYSKVRYFNLVPKSIAVSYVKVAKDKKTDQEHKDVQISKENKLDHNLKSIIDRKEMVVAAKKESLVDYSKFSGPLTFDKEKVSKISAMDIDRKIMVPSVSSDKMINPKYLHYKNQMGDVIRSNVVRYLTDQKLGFGDVYVTFVLASNGALQQIKIIEDKTQANDKLKELAMRSVQTSLFQPFPKGFDFPEATFNILITFKE